MLKSIGLAARQVNFSKLSLTEQLSFGRNDIVHPIYWTPSQNPLPVSNTFTPPTTEKCQLTTHTDDMDQYGVAFNVWKTL